jgi:uncharacterized protein RhaS with RHS repeats
MGTRYYDPVAGRLLSVDAVGFCEANIHSFNRYAYANNNPYRYFDPDGHDPREWWLRGPNGESAPAIVVGSAFGGIAAFIHGSVTSNDALKISAAEGLRESRAEYGGSQTNSPAAKAAREAGEGQPCPSCGETMISGTKTAPTPQHEPSLFKHWYDLGGSAMTKAERIEWARSGTSINGTQCIRCHHREGAALSRESRQKAKDYEP